MYMFMYTYISVPGVGSILHYDFFITVMVLNTMDRRYAVLCIVICACLCKCNSRRLKRKVDCTQKPHHQHCTNSGYTHKPSPSTTEDDDSGDSDSQDDECHEDNPPCSTSVTLTSSTTTTKSDIHTNFEFYGPDSGDNFTAVYVVVLLIIVATVVIVIIFVFLRRRKPRNTLQLDDEARVIEDSPDIPMSCPPGPEYSEIPADEILSTDAPAKPYSTTDAQVLDQHEYGRLQKQQNQTNENYSHLGNVSKPEHTDNTYSHIANGSESVKAKQKPSDKLEEDYDKKQRMPKQNKLEGKHIQNMDSDPDYNHLLSNWKPNIENKSNYPDEYSHIGQSIKQDGKKSDAKISPKPVYETAGIDEKTDQLAEGDGSDYEIAVTTTPADFALKPENEKDVQTAEGSDRHYFILEKHERDTDKVADDEVQSGHQYFVLEKQEEADI